MPARKCTMQLSIRYVLFFCKSNNSFFSASNISLLETQREVRNPQNSRWIWLLRDSVYVRGIKWQTIMEWPSCKPAKVFKAMPWARFIFASSALQSSAQTNWSEYRIKRKLNHPVFLLITSIFITLWYIPSNGNREAVSSRPSVIFSQSEK